MHTVDHTKIDFTLLQNPHLPAETLPTTYNLEAYSNAILYHKGLHSKSALGPIDLCTKCKNSLVDRKKQPLDSLANFQYYAHNELPVDVKNCFENASVYDLMLVSRSRIMRITHLFSGKRDCTAGGNIS